MQGKGLVQFFLVLLLAVVAYQFLLILPTRRAESKARAHAAQVSGTNDSNSSAYIDAEAAYLDEISNEEILNLGIKKYTYQELKGQQLAMGLDLQGGMSVVMQVDLVEMVKKMAAGSQNANFLAALEGAKEEMRGTSGVDYITLFREKFNEVAPGEKLANIFAVNPALQDKLNFDSSDDEVVQLLRGEADETVQRTFELLKKRIDKTGVTQPNVTLDERVDRIIVELPGVKNPQRVRDYLTGTAKLQFWETYRFNDPQIQGDLQRADQALSAITPVESTPTIEDVDSTKMEFDDVGNRIDDFYKENKEALETQSTPTAIRNVLGSLLTYNNGQYAQSVHAVANERNKKKIDSLLSRREVTSNMPNDAEFRWSADPFKDYRTGETTEDYELYVIKTNRQEAAPVEGDNITDARSDLDGTRNIYTVSLNMNQEGARAWGQMTRKNLKREVAITLDDEVVSAPTVQSEINNGRTEITGNFSPDEATDLANILKIGKLPAEPQIIEEAIVGPTLGEKNIRSGLTSLAVGLALVLIFMILYYGTGGVFSIIALLANILFLVGTLSSYGTVLTMAGIAGIVLTIGMAVDANVIIYERIREELRAGKTMGTAIVDGFNASYSAIIDANVTTILVAGVLAYFGQGPIKGFAVVLIFGVLCSLFAAVLLTRLMIDWWISKDRPISFATPMFKNAFSNLNIDFVGKGKYALMFSGAIILLGLGSIFTKGFDLGVDFTGGRSYTVLLDDAIDTEKMRSSLGAAFEGNTPVVKTFGSSNQIEITTKYLSEDNSKDADDQVIAALYKGVNEYAGGTLGAEQAFREGRGALQRSSKKGPTIADDTRRSSFISTFLALLLIFAYIWIRFRKWQYSLGAVAALFHDVLIVLSVFSLLHGILPFSLEIDQAFIAALLTVVGYSINDTVVVFDRIREFFDSYTGKSKEEVINLGVNNTISRTIITSLTTLFVILMLFLFGGAVIRGFAFALLIGVLVGTYSSVFVATPVVNYLTSEAEFRRTKSGRANTDAKKKGYQRRVTADADNA